MDCLSGFISKTGINQRGMTPLSTIRPLKRDTGMGSQQGRGFAPEREGCPQLSQGRLRLSGAGRVIPLPQTMAVQKTPRRIFHA